MKSRMRFRGHLLLAGILIVLLCCGCVGNNTENTNTTATDKVKATENVQAVSDERVQQSDQAEQAEESEQDEQPVQQIEKDDNSVRAIGEAAGGQLIVKPASHATAVPLGAPSCYGLESDIKWQGDYEAYWATKGKGSAEESAAVFTFPSDFEIIQRTEAPIMMQSFKLGYTELITFVPRYTDCHAQETYFFGVEDGEAFPVPLHVQDDLTWPNIGQLPYHNFKVDDERDELILTGGYGAGQEYINVYHFVYDAKSRVLELKQTEQIKPADIPADSTNS
ncbi:hypothetical protein [Paenibacillus sp. OV219]|uniref:hypothetical protein n=1 Tax=Paenibacillus sp. OV219 TaxID=1884377 RepID=UPI0008D71EF4|nr:hypothetical protein [Paenibacillus sp. OV219]SEN03955.1 hypothetical protein SAMN05518847_10213 [Paenibacillus sp. OV219]